ncbi:hypothetical protein FSP39_013528 [Pinctada imbricata]|uniref:Fucosyltransferase n=1 Tax=Pinctada imbricata TaxID=66713 RepID=A0AA89BZU0_PINIB|nr:hypothetical protein FSP39_013528 [Pinctada imbricata]
MKEKRLLYVLVLIVSVIGLSNIYVMLGLLGCKPTYYSGEPRHTTDTRMKVDINMRDLTVKKTETPAQGETAILREKVFNTFKNDSRSSKLIYVHGRHLLKQGDDIFHKLHCPIRSCSVTTQVDQGPGADLVLLGFFSVVPKNPPFPRKSRDQIWAIQILEAPSHEPYFDNYNGLVNWTMTYRSDSTIQFPYFKFKYYAEPEMRQKVPNFAAGKSKKVAWLTSNLNAKFRNKYFKELSKYIQTDRIGRKSVIECPYEDMYDCLDKLKRNYKFYFAAENLFCNEYMTEKVGRNSYKYEMIPILLGARKEDYEKRLPPNSYIFAEDFKSPEHLAEYLHKLDKNDTMYNEYFNYRKTIFVEEEFSPPWCEICRRLHEEDAKPFWYDDIKGWWRKDACRSAPYHLLGKS